LPGSLSVPTVAAPRGFQLSAFSDQFQRPVTPKRVMARFSAPGQGFDLADRPLPARLCGVRRLERRGIRHPLQAILAVATCAVLAGQRSFVAIANTSLLPVRPIPFN